MSAQFIRDGVSGKSIPVTRDIRLRGGSGLGDALYLRPIAEHLARGPQPVVACSNFPDVFLGAENVRVEAFRRDRIDVIAHYVGGKNNPTTTIWDDLCAHAGVNVPLRFEWTVRNRALVHRLGVKAAGRPIVVVHGGREPMGRRDKFGIDMLPFRDAFLAALAGMPDVMTVRIGRGDVLYNLPADVDLWNQTSVADTIDIAAAASGVVSMCGFPVPLAEALDKPALYVWAAGGLASKNPFVKTVTPQKILSKPSSRFVMDDWPHDQIREAASAFRSIL